MVCQLLIAFPLSYFIAFKAGRWELPLLLLLVLVDELNPIVRIYAWRMLLGREGLINDFLMWTRARRRPARLAAVHQVLGDPRALDELGELLRPAHLRVDEGHQPEPVRGGDRSRRRLVHALAPHPRSPWPRPASSSPSSWSTSRCSPTSPRRAWWAARRRTCSATRSPTSWSPSATGAAAPPSACCCWRRWRSIAVIAYFLTKLNQLD